MTAPHAETAKPSTADPGKPQEATVTRGQFLKLFTAVCFPMFLGAVDQTLLATATPTIAADFGDLHNTTWIMSAYLLATAVTVAVYGRLGDRYGRRDVLLASLGLFMLGAVLCGLAPTLNWLILGRTVQGVGGGGLISLSIALIGELVSPRQRASFQGYFSAVFTTSNVLGPILGGLVVSQFSWRWLFAAYLPLGALAVWRITTLPRGRRNPNAPGVGDLGGLTLFAIGILALLFAFSSAGVRFGWLSWSMAALLGLGALAWTAMYLHARRHPAPFFPFALLRNPVLRLPLINVGCTAFCIFALIFYLPIYLQLALRSGAGQSGLMLAPVMLGMVTGSITGSQIAARTGRPQPPPMYGLSLATLALLGLAVLPPSAPAIVTLGFLCGLGCGPSMPIAQVMAQVAGGREHMGAAVAMLSLARTLGAALGTAVIGGVVYSLLPDLDLKELVRSDGAEGSPEIVRAFQTAYFCAALVAAYGAFNASRVPKVKL